MTPEKKLDKAFSLWIRLRDSDERGYGFCCTSGKPLHFKDGQCGHFISRRHKATRWNEQNCAMQSVAENIFNQGNQFEFSKYVDKRWGKGTADKLLVLSRGTSHWGKFELEALVKHYNEKAKELLSKKSI